MSNRDPAECRAFRKCFSVLADGISDPGWLGLQLYSRELIGREVRTEAQKSAVEERVKIVTLLSAVEDQILTSPATKFRELLDVLQNDRSLHYLATILENTYRELSGPRPSSQTMLGKFQLKDVEDAAKYIHGAVRKTPLEKSRSLSEMLKMNIYLKKDCVMEGTGSFKARGACCTLMQLTPEQKKRGVITASAGNHALALAYYGMQLNIPVTVVLPTAAPRVKVDLCRMYKANIILCGKDIGEAKEFAAKKSEDEGLQYVNGYNDLPILAGHGVAALEVLEQMDKLGVEPDAIVIPVGGGGLLAGMVTVIKHLKPHMEIIAVESEMCPSFIEAIKAGEPVKIVSDPTTLADALNVPMVGATSFKIVCQYTSNFETLRMEVVREEHIKKGIQMLYEKEEGLVVEGAGAITLAACMYNLRDHLQGKNVVLLLTGRNIHPKRLQSCLRGHWAVNLTVPKMSTSQSYCAHLYHTMKQNNDWRFYFVITKDLDAMNMVVREHYGHFARKEATLRVGFMDSEITLNIPDDGLVTREGWRISPLTLPTISRKDVDQFKEGQWIPECQLTVQWEKEDQRPVRLRHKVDLIGAKAPYNFIYLTLDPAEKKFAAKETLAPEPERESEGSIRGVEVIKKTEITFLDQGGTFEWRGYGLRLHVSKDSLPSGTAECRINIRVSLSGQFQLPEGSDLLSPVFWIMAPCKFTKPVTLEIQHCALREDETALSHLSFVSANCSQKDLPYRFRQVAGGVFTTHSSYGSIQRTHFSGFGIVGRLLTPRSYCAHLYHTMSQVYDWRFYFVITKDLDANNTVVKEYYGHFTRKEATLRVIFMDSKITLDIPVDGLVAGGGWRITPFTTPTISRKDADRFKKGQWIPECQLIVQWEREGQRPVRLRHKVDLIGAKPPYNFIHLILDPAGTQSSPDVGDISGIDSTPLKEDDLRDVRSAVASLAGRWKDLGTSLGIRISDLDEIVSANPHSPRDCLREMLTKWLKRNHNVERFGTPTWRRLAEAVRDDMGGNNQALAQRIAEEHPGSQ